jgi:Uncharacterized protein conserved in bacteria (DUF2199)
MAQYRSSFLRWGKSDLGDQAVGSDSYHIIMIPKFLKANQRRHRHRSAYRDVKRLPNGCIMNGFRCSTCGAHNDDLPMSYGADAPYWYDVIAPEERERRAELSSDQCFIDEKHFFV